MFPKKNIVFIISFFLFSLNILGQNTELVALLIPSELKEDANAVVRNSSIEITIEEVDKMIVTKREVVTVLNKLGNTDARIVEAYDDDTKITDLSAIIYDAFGNEIKKYKERDFLDVSAVDGGTLYSDSRVKYVDYNPISYPYTLVFESTYKTSTTGFIPGWFPVNGYYISVEKSSYKINNPNAIPWRKKEANFEGFNIEKNESETALSYSIENQKAYEYENSSLSSRDFLPILKIALNQFSLKGVYGEANNWKEFGKWMHKALLEGRDVIDEATKNEVLNLVKDVKTPFEKAKIVYQFMQNKTRYISVQVGIGGWEPIAANQVDEVGYGDCKGLANYTKALLDVVGVTAYYTVVYAQEKRNLDKEFASIQGNHVILNLPNDGKDIWLECTSQTAPFGFLGDFTDDRDVLVITPEGGIIKHTTQYKDDVNLQTTKAEITLTNEGDVTANLKRISEGTQYDSKYYLKDFTEEELYKNYKSRVWSYNNNLEINSHKLNNDKENVEFTEDLDITIKDYATINENEYLFRVNVFNNNNYVPKRYRNRVLPLKIDRGYKDVDEYNINLPAEYNITALPENTELETKFGVYKVSFEKINDTSFMYKRELSIKEGTHSKEDYDEYRDFRKKVAKLENIRIAISKK